MARTRIDRDLHVHSNVSWCAAGEMSLESIAHAAARQGIGTVGIADHLWLDPKRGCRPAVDRLLSRRETARRLAEKYPSLPGILIGAEADCAPGSGMAGAGSDFHFVIAAYHFADVREGRTPWPRTPEELAALLLGGFRSILDAPGVSVAGHPFYIPPSVLRRLPEELTNRAQAAMDLVLAGSRDLLQEAAKRGIPLEMNFRALGEYHRSLLAPVFRLARDCGCSFTVSSDSHRLSDIGRGRLLADYLGAIGIAVDSSGPAGIAERS